MALKVQSYQLILILGLAIFAFLIVKAVLFFTAKPTISVNYAAEWNRMTEPNNYDANINAFFDYEQAANLAKEIPTEIRKDRVSYPAVIPDISVSWPGDMNDRELGILRQWLADNDAAIKFLRQGSKKPYYWNKISEKNIKMWELYRPLLYKMSECLQVLCCHAKLNAFENKPEKSLEDLLACFNISNQFISQSSTDAQQEGMELSTITIRASLDILANTTFDADMLWDFQRKMLQKFSEQKKKFDFTGEKIAAFDILQHIFTDDGRGNGHFIPKEYKKIQGDQRYSSGLISPSSTIGFDSIKDFIWNFFEIMKGNAKLYEYALDGHNRKQTIEMLETYIKHLEDLQDISPWQKTNNPPDNKIEGLLKNYLIFSCYCSSYYASENWHKYKTEESALLTIVAILLYKSEKGTLPGSLNELFKSGLLTELPQDPYNDGPLTYKKDGDNFKLYSFGLNMTDNDGTIVRNAYSGQIEWWDQRGDTVFWPNRKETNEERKERLGKLNFGYGNVIYDGPAGSNDANYYQ